MLSELTFRCRKRTDSNPQDDYISTRRLRKLGYGKAILAVTAFGSEELNQSWFQAGSDDFLEKPTNKQELISAVLRQTTAEKESVL